MSHFFSKLNFNKSLFPCAMFSVFFSFTIIIGHSLFNYNTLDNLLIPNTFIKNLLLFLILALGLTFFSILLLSFSNYLETKHSRMWCFFNHPWYFGILFFLCWLPCYLAYYPGIVSYDMDSQLPQILGTVAYSKYHPPLHTFLYQICHMLGNLTGFNGLVIYSISQMLLLALAFAYLIRLFTILKVNNFVILASIAFICLNPMIALFSFIPTKDVSFTICLIFYSVELCLFLKQNPSVTKNNFAMVRLICFGILCCLFRNNMIYAVILSAVISLFLLRNRLKHLLICNGFIIIIYFLISGPLYSMLNVNPGNPREMLSIPIQQIASVCANNADTLSQDTLDTLNQYLPVDELNTLYNPRFADPVKNTFNSEYFKENSSSFFEIWFELLKNHPEEYITAFLNLNLPYWYIDAPSLDSYSNRMYIETYIYSPSVTDYDVARDSKLPWLYEKYEVFANFYAIQKIPVISHIFSISLPIWILLFTCTILIAKKRKRCIYVILPHICYWLTFLLGPVSNLRYIFPIIAIYPLYVALIINTQDFLPKTNK